MLIVTLDEESDHTIESINVLELGVSEDQG